MNDDFWDDLLAHIRQRVLVPVVGPDVTVVENGNADLTFSTLIGQRLVERWGLSVSPGPTTMDEAVAAFVRERGQDEIERLYRVINDIIVVEHGFIGELIDDIDVRAMIVIQVF